MFLHYITYTKLCDELMSIELSLNEKFDILVDGFENHTVDAKNILLEAQQLFFREVEDLEGRFFKNMRTLCFDLIEKYLRGEAEEEALTEEAVSLVFSLQQLLISFCISALYSFYLIRVTLC